MMVPVGRLTLVQNVPQIRTHAHHELRLHSRRSSLPCSGPVAGGFIVDYFHWRVIFFLNIPIGIVGLDSRLSPPAQLREDDTPPLDIVGLILFGSGIALLSYVLEVFGEHTLSAREIVGLLALSWHCSSAIGCMRERLSSRLLRLRLFSIRTFRAAVNGSFFTRLGIGGVPFLLPLLYQVGLGFTPIQSGLLIMPQALGAMSIKAVHSPLAGASRLSRRTHFEHHHHRHSSRGVFHHRPAHAGLVHRCCWRTSTAAFTSLQYTSMNTLVYADIAEHDTSSASTIASTMQQMSISFGVAAAGLTTAFFVPSGASRVPQEMIHGIHLAFRALGGLTIVSTIVFASLKQGDGDAVSQQKILRQHHPDG